MTILGIETSCDETGAALIHGNSQDGFVKLLQNEVATSLELHAKTGGIIPESAAREQVKVILPVIEKTLQGISPQKDVDAIAVTVGPGLIGSLLVGVETAKTLSYIWNKPLIPVNHLYGHIYANFIRENTQPTSHNPHHLPQFPALALIVSGGHTDLVMLNSHTQVEVIGSTRDDACGEAFDKIGRLLGMPYPAGATIAKRGALGDPKAYALPRPMLHSGDFDFSFSGLKTAVLREVKNNPLLSVIASDFPQRKSRGDLISKKIASSPAKPDPRNDKTIADLCASVQQAIIDVLVYKTIKAAKTYKVQSILLGGGVAANEKLREHLRFEIGDLKLEIPLFVPPTNLCTDNGAMIAAAAYFNNTPIPWQKVTANPELYY